MTKIWLDALTAKQALISGMLSHELQRKGYKCIITCRDYDYVISILKMLGINPVVYGKYGISKDEKAIYSLERELYLMNYWLSHGKPNIQISLTSPDATHVAFKLGIPSLLLSDTPHSVYVNRLTIPLADVVIIPSFLPLEHYRQISDMPRYVRFKGLFELIWIKRLKPNVNDLKALDLEPFKYVILRTEEKYASYYMGEYSEPTVILDVLDALSEFDVQLVVFPRYEDQRRYLESKIKNRYEIIIPKSVINPVSLYRHALLVVTGGSTMAIEASLLGTPSILTFPKELHVVKFLKKFGFPIFQLPIKEAVDMVKNIMSNPKHWRRDTEMLLSNLEDPLPIILENLEFLLSEYINR